MRKLNLKIPPHDNLIMWLKFVSKNIHLYKEYNSLTIDFGITEFLGTDELVLLASFIEVFYHNDCEINFEGGSYKLISHLNNIRLKEYWTDGFNRSDYTESKNSSTLCLWKIHPQMSFYYSIYAQKFYESFTNNKDLLSIASNMDEVFNNIFDHSRSPDWNNGYIMTQYLPNINKLEFSICDFGIGIANCIRESKLFKIEESERDSDLILKSLKAGFSVKSNPKNKGMGLHYISDLANTSNGFLTIASNKGLYRKFIGGRESLVNLPVNFEGTLIKLRVDLSTFEEKETEEYLFDF
ncbi:hypothetical protein ACQY1Q_05910 [Tenacibaculum sp. TC6]|uniref:hypothetical protein n=1 Tax=Tenacibaculum sp. TC6 TaxID=3423223 RepID=UPI003D35D3EF